MIEGQVYTLKEFKEFLGVSDSTWKKNKDKILKDFSNYYKYEIKANPKDSRKKDILIIKKLKEYTKAPKTQKRDELFEKGIIDIIKENGIQSAVSINKILRENVEFIKENYTENTSYEYIRVRLKEYFGKKKDEGGTKGYIARKVWCDRRKDMYKPVPENIVQIFFKYIDKYVFNSQERKEEILNICLDYDHKIITKEERNDLLGESCYYGYNLAKIKILEDFGIELVCVPQYQLYPPIEEEKGGDPVVFSY